jgi:hypothetical protein
LLAKLLAAVRPQFRVEVYVPAPDNSVLGRPSCAVPGCDRSGWEYGLCGGHSHRWRSRGRPDLVEFLADHLLDISAQGRGQLGRHGGPCGGPGRGLVGMGLTRRHGEHTSVEQGGFGTEQRGGQGTDPVPVGTVPTNRRGQLFASGIQIGLGSLSFFSV